MKVNTSENFKNYQSKSGENGKINTLSICECINLLEQYKDCCLKNGKNPYETPVFINFNNELHLIPAAVLSCSKNGMYGLFESSDWYKFSYVAPDIEDPASTDVVWRSRGVSDGLDVSGFVNSRPAGIRLLHMVQEILGTEKTASNLDYRENEPDWIQFKFSAKEFDVYKLDEISKNAGDILNKKIINECKLPSKK
jgi:hypothetical protein